MTGRPVVNFWIPLLVLSLSGLAPLAAYVRDRAPLWPQGTVALHLQLGSSPRYTDGNTPNEAAAAALQLWNAHMGRVQLSAVAGSTIPKEDGDGKNSVFFASDYYGRSFGTGVLAVTLISYSNPEQARRESDVVVNSGRGWDSYRGPLRGDKIDLRRVLLHEFGHVLGLNHPDEVGQWGHAIMNSHVSDVEIVTPDDSMGVGSAYGSGRANPVAAPVIETEPLDQTVHAGQFAYFSVSVVSDWPPLYQWRKDGVAIPAATDPTLGITAALSDAGRYDVQVSNGGGRVLSRGAVLNVLPAELGQVKLEAASTAVHIGDHISLHARVTGTAPFTFTWFKQGELQHSHGYQQDRFSYPVTSAADAGQYMVRVENAAGAATAEIEISVLPRPLPGAINFGHETATEGEPLRIEIPWRSDPGPVLEAVWYHNGEVATRGSHSHTSYSVPVATAADAGTYLLVVRNESGYRTSLPVRVTFRPREAIRTRLISARSGDQLVFLLPQPARLERFDLKQRRWLSTQLLPAEGTALAASGTMLYVGLGDQIAQVRPDGTIDPLPSLAEWPIADLGVMGTMLYVLSGPYGQISALDLNSGDWLSPEALGSYEGGDLTVAPKMGRLIVAPSQHQGSRAVVLRADGRLWYDWTLEGHHDFRPDRIYVSPDENVAFMSSGEAFELREGGAAGYIPAFDDWAATPNGEIVTVAGRTLHRYTGTLREIGHANLSFAALAVAAYGDDVFAFGLPSPPNGQPDWVRMASKDVAAIPTPQSSVDPTKANYPPDDVLLDRNQDLLVLSRLGRGIFHWSVAQQKYLPTIQLTGTPQAFAYSSAKHTVYVAYADGRVAGIALTGDRREMTVRHLRDPVREFVAGDNVLFALSADRISFLSVDGAHHATIEARYVDGLAWDPVHRRLFLRRDGDLMYVDVDSLGKPVASRGSTIDASLPMRPSPDGKSVLLGAGLIYDARTLDQKIGPYGSVSDGAWLNETVYTLNFAPDGALVRRWVDANTRVELSRNINGYPVRIFAAGTTLHVVTLREYKLQVTVLDADLNVVREAHGPAPQGRMINLSSRAEVAAGGDLLIAGFAVSGTEPARMLFRAIGPALGAFGVEGYLPNPELEIFDAAGRSVAYCDDWDRESYNGTRTLLREAFQNSGAFALEHNSRDAALIATLPPGNYTAHVRGGASPTGVALVEFYQMHVDLSSSRLNNISSRAKVGTGSNVLITGMVVGGSHPKHVLIRGIGPGLERYGVAAPLEDPVLEIYRGEVKIAENDDWTDTATMTDAFAKVGAFKLDRGSGDAAMIVILEPGTYSAIVRGADGGTGVALLESYELPD